MVPLYLQCQRHQTLLASCMHDPLDFGVAVDGMLSSADLPGFPVVHEVSHTGLTCNGALARGAAGASTLGGIQSSWIAL